jgi:hypothetical protein
MLLAGGLLGVGALPCPDCGTPMIFHIWPLAGLLIVFQAMRKRMAAKRKPEDSLVPQPPADIQILAKDNK